MIQEPDMKDYMNPRKELKAHSKDNVETYTIYQGFEKIRYEF